MIPNLSVEITVRPRYHGDVQGHYTWHACVWLVVHGECDENASLHISEPFDSEPAARTYALAFQQALWNARCEQNVPPLAAPPAGGLGVAR